MKYYANTPLMHRGKHVPVDGSIDLTEQEAAILGTAVRLATSSPQSVEATAPEISPSSEQGEGVEDTDSVEHDSTSSETEETPRRRTRAKSTENQE